MPRIIAPLLALVLIVSPAWADGPSRAKLGAKVPNLVLQGEKGERLALQDLKDKKAIVLVFFSFECPVSNSYCQPLIDMHKEFAKHGVAFIGLTVNDDDTAAHVAKQAREFSLTFPVFRDRNLEVARAVEANFTPECFVLDGSYTLRYRGRIDNSYSERLKKHQRVTKHDLRQVIGELLSGRPVAEPTTQAIGCPLVREEPKVAKAGNVTYHKDVQPILQNHCQMCHRPGEVGPFSLLTYKQAVNWAPDIKAYTQSKAMPPWKPSAGVAMHGERRLTEKEITTLAAWADGGTPAGDPKDAPPAREFTEGWRLGKPDLILAPTGDIVVGPNGKDLFRCFVLPTNLPEDVYVSAVEPRPGNPRIVHHLLLYLDMNGQGRKLEAAEKNKKGAAAPVDDDHPQVVANPEWDKGPGYTSGMGPGFIPQGTLSGWSPGITPRHLPAGTGYYLPKNADIVVQVHYHRNGRVERDRTQIGLYFTKKPAERPYSSGVLAGGQGAGVFRTFFSIPPGDDNFKLTGDGWATKDFTLYSISPHMHLLGKSISLTMTPPDGEKKTLIAIDAWDYNWQEIYFLKEPIQVKAGTRFHVDAAYDNSPKNPLNPFNPPRRITFGEQTTNEMCYVFLGGTSNLPIVGRVRSLPVSSSPPPKEAGTN
jgi:peroxiredoxin/mono/diheme cytochrome c family protein